jgi:hypothetical protein
MVIGKLAVQLGLQSAQFNTGIHQAGNRVRGFREEVRSSTSIMSKFQTGMRSVAAVAAAATAATAAAAYATFRAIRGEMERIDKIGKAANKLGIATEMFTGLEHAAALSGVEMEALETSLAKMAKGLSEAAIRGGPTADTLREIGLSAQTLADMTPNDALYKLADAIKAVENPMDRVRIATVLFGRAGVDMLPMLEGGAQGLRDMQREAERLGLTFSQSDFRQIEAANDAITRLGRAFGALKRQFAITFAPIFTVIAETITEGMIKATAAVNDHVRSVVNAGLTYNLLSESVFYLADSLDRAWQGMQLLTLKMQNMTLTALKGAKAMAEFLNLQGNVQEFERVIAMIERDMASMSISLGVDMAFDQTLGDKMRARYQEILDGINNSARSTGAYLDDAAESANELREALDFRPKLLEEGTQEFYEALSRWENMNLQGGMQPMPQPIVPEPMQKPIIPEPIQKRIEPWVPDITYRRPEPMPQPIVPEPMQKPIIPEPIRQRIEPEIMIPEPIVPEVMIPEPIRQRIEFNSAVFPTFDPDPVRVPVVFDVPGWDMTPRHVTRVTPQPEEPRGTDRLRGLDSGDRLGDDRLERIAEAAEKSTVTSEKALSEASRTTEASRRTASAVERMELPVTVEF